MKKCKPEIVNQTTAFWHNLSGKRVTSEDARQGVENISGFFSVLEDWRSKEQKKTQGSCLSGNLEIVSNSCKDK